VFHVYHGTHGLALSLHREISAPENQHPPEQPYGLIEADSGSGYFFVCHYFEVSESQPKVLRNRDHVEGTVPVYLHHETRQFGM
jgi:hypothetical protein